MNINKKLTSKIVGGIIAGALLIGGGAYFMKNGGSNNNDKVFCQTVSEIMGQQSLSSNRFSGKVEASQTENINRDYSKEISEVMVKVGDHVSKGQALFKYDTSEISNQIAMSQVDVDGAYNNIELYQNQIRSLENKKPDGWEFEVQEKEMMIQSERQTINRARAEIERYNQEISKAVVYAKIDGIIKEINSESYDMYGNSKAYMTIMSSGDYRIKMNVDEMNIAFLSVDMEVTVRSRVDENITWSGTISLIDTNTTVSENNNYYYDGNSSEKASQYPVYITLDSTENLLLGQHVLVELGKVETVEGIALDASYFVFEGDQAYIWKDNGKNKLVKQKVIVSDLNEENYTYTVLEGLSENDRICWPMNGLYEGVSVVDNPADVDYSSSLYQQDYNDNIDDNDQVDEKYDPEQGQEIPEQYIEIENEAEANDDTNAE